jgi:hypothetical protein
MKAFDEAVRLVRASPETSYIGFLLRPKKQRVEWYKISTDPDDSDDPGYVSVQYEGGVLFSSDGEEDFYSAEDVPIDAKSLLYVESSTLPDMGWYTAEHVLFLLFPELPDPESLWGEARGKYMDAAVLVARRSGLATIEVI